MLVQNNLGLRPYNTLGIAARARCLARVRSEAELVQYMARADWAHQTAASPPVVLGGGSNVVITGDIQPLVLKVEIGGRTLLEETPKGWLVQAGAGESWHDFVSWTLAQGWHGLENLALIPGTVGGAPVQNIGAYGVELQDRFDSLDAIDLHTGRAFTLRAEQCGFGYRESVFKRRPSGPRSVNVPPTHTQALITRVRFWLPKAWQPVLGYQDLERKIAQTGVPRPSAQEIFDWVVEIRRTKLPDPTVLGNVGSFFKNPTVSAAQCADIVARDPQVVHYRLPNGSFKLAAGWLIEACGWRGKRMGDAGVYERQALVLVNQGQATGAQIMTLAQAIQTSVYARFGIELEPEPVVW